MSLNSWFFFWMISTMGRLPSVFGRNGGVEASEFSEPPLGRSLDLVSLLSKLGHRAYNPGFQACTPRVVPLGSRILLILGLYWGNLLGVGP